MKAGNNYNDMIVYNKKAKMKVADRFVFTGNNWKLYVF